MDTNGRLKLPLSKVTSDNFLAAMRVLGSEKLPLKTAYKIGRMIKLVNGYIEDFNRAKINCIKSHHAEEVASAHCCNAECGNNLTGPKGYDALCEKCGCVTMVSLSSPTFLRIPPADKNAIEAFRQDMEEALAEEVEIFLDQKLRIEDLEGIKIPSLVMSELIDIFEDPTELKVLPAATAASS